MKRPFPHQAPSFSSDRDLLPRDFRSISLARTGFHGHPELPERLGKSSFKILLVSIIEEGRGDGIGMPFGLPVHSFSQRPAKAPRRGGFEGAEGQVGRGQAEECVDLTWRSAGSHGSHMVRFALKLCYLNRAPVKWRETHSTLSLET